MRARLAALTLLIGLPGCLPIEDGSRPVYGGGYSGGYGSSGYGGLGPSPGWAGRGSPYGYGQAQASPWGGSGWGGPGWGGGWNGGYQPRNFRTDDRVVCDRATEICYKRGRIDKSETEEAFGDRAADRADDLRDRYGRADLYVPRRGVVCDDDREVCFKNGHPDRSETRSAFGKGAARRID